MGLTSSRAEGGEHKGIGCLRYGCGQSLGRKHVQEDAFSGFIGGHCVDPTQRSGNLRGFFTVCDGHGGKDAANFTSRNLMKYFLLDDKLEKDCAKAMFSSIMRADAEFDQQVGLARQGESGTTAIAMAIVGSRYIIGNTGDCRALLCRSGKCYELTRDHRPQCKEERKRIEEAGGFVDCDGYLNGDIGVSRAIGDHQYKLTLPRKDGCAPLIADPDVVDHVIHPDDEFIVLVSDGVTEGLSSQTIVNLVRASLRQFNCPDQASEKVVRSALKSEVSDNLTALTVCLKTELPSKKKISHAGSRLRIDPNSRSFQNMLKGLNHQEEQHGQGPDIYN